MFYCNKCAIDKGWPKSLFKSAGKCECCDNIALCNEIQSSRLPKPKN